MVEPQKTGLTARQKILSGILRGLTAALDNRAIQVAMILLFGVGVAFILTPGLRRKEPVLTEASIGKEARQDIKATRTFEVDPSEEELERKRNEAARRVLTVYDYYPARYRILYESLMRAFKAVSHREGLYREPPAPRVPSNGKPGVGRPARPDRPARGPNKGARPDRPPARSRPGARRSREPDRPRAVDARPEDRPLDPKKVAEALENRGRIFNDTLNRAVGQFLGLKVTADRSTYGALIRFVLVQNDGLAVVDETLRSVLLDDVLLDKKYVKSADELKTADGQDQKKIVLRTIRHRVDDDREEVSREVVLDNLTAIGELRDLRERLTLKIAGRKKPDSKNVREALIRVVKLVLTENVTRNDSETTTRRRLARERIQKRPIIFVKGQVLVRAGEKISTEHAAIVKRMVGEQTITGPWQVAAGISLFVLLFSGLVIWYGRNHIAGFSMNRRDIFVAGVVLLALMGLAQTLDSLAAVVRWSTFMMEYFMPVAAGTMLVRLLMGTGTALVFSVGASALCTLAMDGNAILSMYLFLSGVVGAGSVSKVQTRFVLWRAGGVVALANAVMVVLLRTFAGELFNVGTLQIGAAAILGGLASGFLASALLPVLEWMGGFTTDVTLLELANLNHPLLRELLMTSPGTHHHSMIVGSLAEAGANAIGANGLAARVAAYYHDVGKMRSAQYFAENQHGENPHEKLKPSMSALIIKNHLKDSREILRNHRIPEVIQEVALSHHGTTLIEYFYNKAKEQAAEDEEVREDDFRYPGPKPQTREAAILMLADAVEAAVKSVPDPDEERIRGVVDRVINKKFIDGQLEDCDLTLKDLHAIAGAFLNVLTGMYHQRPVYPGQKEGFKPVSKAPSDMRAITTTRELKHAAKAKERADRAAREEAEAEAKAETRRPEEEAEPEGPAEGTARSPKTEPPAITLEYAIRKKGTDPGTADDPTRPRTSTFPPAKAKDPSDDPA